MEHMQNYRELMRDIILAACEDAMGNGQESVHARQWLAALDLREVDLDEIDIALIQTLVAQQQRPTLGNLPGFASRDCVLVRNDQ